VAIRDIKGKGKGLVATRFLKEGEVVLQELPLLVGHLTSSTAWTGGPQATSLLVKKLVQTFNNLVPEQQALVLSLHAPEHSESRVNHPELGEKEKRLLRIFASNNIEIDQERCGLYEVASRINHSCSPNAYWEARSKDTKLTVRTCQAVALGEEAVVDYYIFDNFPTREERLTKINKERLFACRCSLCSLPEDEVKKDDAKRTRLRKMQSRTEEILTMSPDRRRKAVLEMGGESLAVVHEMGGLAQLSARNYLADRR